MSSIDDRIVKMNFDNGQFERGVGQTMKSLDGLKKGLNLDGAKQSLDGLSEAGKRFSLSNIASGVDTISQKFTTLGLMGIGVLTNLANKAISSGMQIAKSLTIDPIMSGLREYETQLNSVQTILANTQSKGGNIETVTAALDELNTYADKTIYNFTEMTRNIGTFTAAGVDLDKSVAAIKGISNLAALSGSNSQQASTAMYQLSQALATGTVKLMDWNSVVNAGMGGEVFQNAIKETARAHGINIDAIIEKNGSFRESLQEGWLSAEIMLETLSKFTGDLSAEQLKQMGYTDVQIEEIMKLGQTANDAATKVKTFSQLIETLQEAAQSGWAKTWQILFGDFEEAKALFTDVSNTLGPLIEASAEARNNLLQGWSDLGGRAALIESIANVFNFLMSVLEPIGDAFREIFPPATAEQLMSITTAIKNFTETLKMGVKDSENLKNTFKGLFAILSIGWQIIKSAAGALASLLGFTLQGSGSILAFTGTIGEWLSALDAAIKRGDVFGKFFGGLGELLKIPIGLLKNLGSLIAGVFESISGPKVDVKPLTDGFGHLARSFELFFGAGTKAAKVMGQIASAAKQLWTILAQGDFVGGVFEEDSGIVKFFFTIREAIVEFSSWLKGALANMGLDNLANLFKAGAFAGMILFIKDLKNVLTGFADSGSGILDSITGVFEGLTGQLTAMQNNVKANTLLKIAGALALLAAAVVALSLVDPDRMNGALKGIGIMLGELFIAMSAFEKMAGAPGIVKLPIIASSLILLAIAVDLLAVAVVKLAGLRFGDLLRGLLGLAGILALLVKSAQALNGVSKGFMRTSASLILLAVAVGLLADSVEQLGGLSWSELAKGLIGVGVVLGALALFTKLAKVNKGAIAQSTGLLLLGVAIRVLAESVKIFSTMDMGSLAKGLVSLGALLLMIAGFTHITGAGKALISTGAGMILLSVALKMLTETVAILGGMSIEALAKGLISMAAALLIIAGAMHLMPKGMVVQAAALILVAVALGMISDVVLKMSGMSWMEIAKGLVTLAGGLLIIAGAMALMTTALAGAAALLVVSGALSVLAPVLLAFGQMSWMDILQALVMLAGAFVIIGLAGLVLTPVIPSLLGLGAAILLLGIGAAAAGAGVFLFATGLAALAAAGAGAGVALAAIFRELLMLIPFAIEQIGLGIVALAGVIKEGAPAIVDALVTVLMELLRSIDRIGPKIIDTLVRMIMAMVSAITNNVPKLVDSGVRMIAGILQGIANNIGKVVDEGSRIIVEFLNGVSRNLPKIVEAAYNLIITFVESLARTIRNNNQRMADAGWDLAVAIVDGMVRGISTGASRVVQAAKDMASRAWEAAKDMLGIASPSKRFAELGMYSDEGFALGLTRYSGLAEDAATAVGERTISSLRKTLSGVNSLIDSDLNIQPVIKPVMDLSGVKKGTLELNKLTGTPKLDFTYGYSQASEMAKERRMAANAISEREALAAPNVTNINFEQHNNSPKALSTTEIYRQTNNQLSNLREAVRLS